MTARTPYPLRRADEGDWPELDELDRECFPEDTPHDFSRDSVVYVARNPFGPIAYGCARESRWMPSAVYLSRAGVAETHRGMGLQKRLIRARVRWAAGRPVFTYTLGNAPSSNALIACGFRVWDAPFTYSRPNEVWWLRRPEARA